MPITLVKFTLQERVRARLRGLVQKGEVSAEVLGEHLGLSRSGVSRILNEEGYSIMLPHIETFCIFFQITPAELMTEPHSIIQPVSPIEAAFLDILRSMTELERRSLMTVLERPIASHGRREKKSRLGRAMLTVKEQELVDLFGRVKRDGVREGVLRTLKGAAQDDETAAPVKDRTTG